MPCPEITLQIEPIADLSHGCAFVKLSQGNGKLRMTCATIALNDATIKGNYLAKRIEPVLRKLARESVVFFLG